MSTSQTSQTSQPPTASQSKKEIVTTRTGIGAGIGAALGFMVGGPIGAGVGLLLGGGVTYAAAKKPVLTPQRELVFKRAMASIKEPADLRKLAAAFKAEGLKAEAAALEKRAALREMPAEQKEARRAAFRKGMNSDNPAGIMQLAQAFASEGASDAAKALRDHANAVAAAHAAGKSAKPMMDKDIKAFADKLGKAIIHFGPASAQAQSAAKNFLNAQGKPANDAAVREMITLAAGALEIEMPAAAQTTADASQAAEQAAAAPATTSDAVEADATSDMAAVDKGDAGVPEPTVVGPPAAPVEAEVVKPGDVPVEGA